MQLTYIKQVILQKSGRKINYNVGLFYFIMRYQGTKSNLILMASLLDKLHMKQQCCQNKSILKYTFNCIIIILFLKLENFYQNIWFVFYNVMVQVLNNKFQINFLIRIKKYL